MTRIQGRSTQPNLASDAAIAAAPAELAADPHKPEARSERSEGSRVVPASPGPGPASGKPEARSERSEGSRAVPASPGPGPASGKPEARSERSEGSRVVPASPGPGPADRPADFIAALFRRRAPAVAAVLLGATLFSPQVASAPGAPAVEPQPAPVAAPAVVAEAPRPVESHGFGRRVDRNASGAYFRKVESRADARYGGIETVGSLPSPTFDPERQFVAPEGLDFYRTGPLDRPSVYLGGHGAGRELDAGLTWDRVYDGAGRATYTDRAERTDGGDPRHRFARAAVNGEPQLLDGTGAVRARGQAEVQALMARLQPNFAFRPFWRTTNDGGNQWQQPAVGAANNAYFYPGQPVRMSLRAVGSERISLAIAGEGSSFEVTFRQQGFGGRQAASFKRVSALDQFAVGADGVRRGREKQDVLPTATTVMGGGWTEVHLLDRRGERLEPMTGARFTEVWGRDTADRAGRLFRTYARNAAGGERIDITPPAR